MARDVLSSQNLGYLQLLGLRLENRASAPANPQNGTAYYDTTAQAVRIFVNGAWFQLDISGVKTGTVAVRDATTPTLGALFFTTDTKVLSVGDGTTWVVSAGGGGGSFASPSQTVVFTVSGTFVKANYPNLIGVRVRGVAGGGGGGGCGASAAGQWASGAGGGGGGYFEKWIPATALAASETVTVGAAGAVGTGSPVAAGLAGGTTSFGAHVSATGGNGGSSGVATAGNGGVAGSAGGTATGGDLNASGGSGDARYASGTGGFASGGKGGNSLLGEGGSHKMVGGSGGGPGEAATGYGAGGGGAAIAPSMGAQLGGAAAPGILVVEVYESLAVADATIVQEVVTLTASGAFVKANYPGLVAVRVRLVGGGGAGRGSTVVNSGGPGGGGGGYAESVIPAASLAASETVTIGAGGVGGTGIGGDGGATSFGAHVAATGGFGGGAGVAYRGGGGGVGTAGQLLVSGDDGQSTGDPALYTTAGIYPGGNGGSSVLGGGSRGYPARAANNAGSPGGSYGGGGGGGFDRTASVNGGDGAAGVVVVEIYRAVVTGQAWDGPRGVLGRSETLSDHGQDGFSAMTDLTNLSKTVTVGANRLLRITGRVALGQVGVAGTMIGYVREGSTALNEFGRHDLNAGQQALFYGAVEVVAPSAGVHTYKLSVLTTAGTGNVQTNSTNPAFITVEDLGPAPA